MTSPMATPLAKTISPQTCSRASITIRLSAGWKYALRKNCASCSSWMHKARDKGASRNECSTDCRTGRCSGQRFALRLRPVSAALGHSGDQSGRQFPDRHLCPAFCQRRKSAAAFIADHGHTGRLYYIFGVLPRQPCAAAAGRMGQGGAIHFWQYPRWPALLRAGGVGLQVLLKLKRTLCLIHDWYAPNHNNWLNNWPLAVSPWMWLP